MGGKGQQMKDVCWHVPSCLQVWDGGEAAGG